MVAALSSCGRMGSGEVVAALSPCERMVEWPGGSCTQLIELIGSGHVVAHSVHVDRWGSRQLVA